MGLLWMVGRIRGMSTLRPRGVVLLGWDWEGSRHGSIGGIVRIVGGWGLKSRLPLRGIESMGGLVLMVLLAYLWRIGERYRCWL